MNDAQFFHRALFDIILFSIIQVVNKYIKNGTCTCILQQS